jgi:hypothetical protein
MYGHAARPPEPVNQQRSSSFEDAVQSLRLIAVGGGRDADKARRMIAALTKKENGR